MMPDKLAHASKGPLTWWIFEPNDMLTVVCSSGHRSHVLHHVKADGTLYNPSGGSGSMHCGKCNEGLPLLLSGWPPDETWTGPRPEKMPPQSTCSRCGIKERFIGGWGVCGTFAGIICAKCFNSVVHGIPSDK